MDGMNGIEFLGWQEDGAGRYRWGGFTWEARNFGGGSNATIAKRVTKLEGDWPANEDLYSLIDGYAPPQRSWFGGRIEERPDGARDVYVHID